MAVEMPAVEMPAVVMVLLRRKDMVPNLPVDMGNNRRQQSNKILPEQSGNPDEARAMAALGTQAMELMKTANLLPKSKKVCDYFSSLKFLNWRLGRFSLSFPTEPIYIHLL
jgi:hypothetical protein